MRLSELPGAGYLFFLLCSVIAAMGYLLLAWIYAVVQIGVVVFTTLSQGVGHG